MVVLAVGACGDNRTPALRDARASDAAFVADAGPDPDVISPPSVDFGAAIVDCPTTAKMFTVTNTGTTTHGPITTSIGGATAGDFMITSDGCTGQSLAPTAACTLSVQFQPATAGAKFAALDVTSSPAVSLIAGLAGTGLSPAPLSISPSTVAFPDTPSGQTSMTKDVTITNNGCATTGSLTPTLGGAAPSQFTISADGCTGVMLAPTTSCTVTLAFSPTTSGAKSASVVISANPGGTVTAAMTGTGL